MCCGLLCVFFFCKQKTADEMRISDWSSDVCSSDLCPPWRCRRACRVGACSGPYSLSPLLPGSGHLCTGCPGRGEGPHWVQDVDVRWPSPVRVLPDRGSVARPLPNRPRACCTCRARSRDRSEEHTSELQSLMRISYAVFCLKKKKKKTTS